jgi:alcohol dehydrogenase class IV
VGVPGLSFEFATATRILFGEARLRDAASITKNVGSRALVVEGRSRRAEPLVRLLEAGGVGVTTLSVAGEPTTALVERGTDQARRERCDVIVALGGGSVIDAGKAIAALVTNVEPLRDYLEVVGNGRPLSNRPVPFIAIPTTAGTGAEVTRNAVLMVEDERVKVSLRSPLMLPAVAIIDPELTYSLPPDVTASTGMDALTQCIEPFVSPQANPITDAVAREGMRRAAGALQRAFHDGRDADARRDMCIASLCGGLALANAKLGAVHGFAAPLGGLFPIPHGVACARLVPPVVGVNVRALRARTPESVALARYDEVARILTGNRDARAEDAAAWLQQQSEDLRIPGLARYGVSETHLASLTAEARRASSMQGNPIVLTDDELAETLRVAM